MISGIKQVPARKASKAGCTITCASSTFSSNPWNNCLTKHTHRLIDVLYEKVVYYYVSCSLIDNPSPPGNSEVAVRGVPAELPESP